MAKKISETIADDSQGWIFCRSYLRLMMSQNTAVYWYNSISWDGTLSSGIS